MVIESTSKHALHAEVAVQSTQAAVLARVDEDIARSKVLTDRSMCSLLMLYLNHADLAMRQEHGEKREG